MTANGPHDAIDDATLESAADAIADGDLVVYPTETVYGLGADALSATAVERVFDAKGRDRSNPISLAVADVEAALAYVEPTDRTVRFMREFLPGPVTVVCPRTPGVPDVLTAGREKVGVRVPDHAVALALADRAGPITATSANRSGAGSARTVGGIDPAVRERAAVVVDGGETPGGASTVVDVAENDVIRPGAMAEDVEAWLERE